ncbi:hypothetical protein VaNZ11_001729, partial [Volvox africanus]
MSLLIDRISHESRTLDLQSRPPRGLSVLGLRLVCVTRNETRRFICDRKSNDDRLRSTLKIVRKIMTCTATIIRSGHAMPPGRVSVSRRLGQAQATIRRGMQDVGGILVGDDNRLYGAVFPGFPLGVSRIRPYSVTSAFPLLCGSMSTSGHNLHASLHASVHATANSAGASKAAAAQSGSVSRASVVCHFLPVENGSGPPSPPRRKGGLSSTSGDDGDKGKHPFASQGWLQHVQSLMVGVTICVGIGLILFICL